MSFIFLFISFKVRELRERLEEAESSGSRKMKAQLSAMDGKIASLEDELEAAQKYALPKELHIHYVLYSVWYTVQFVHCIYFQWLHY